jgi:hypothetical protein
MQSSDPRRIRGGQGMNLCLDEWDMRLNEGQIRPLDFTLNSSNDRSYGSIPYFGRSILRSGISWLDTFDVYWVGEDSVLSPVD